MEVTNVGNTPPKTLAVPWPCSIKESSPEVRQMIQVFNDYMTVDIKPSETAATGSSITLILGVEV